MGAGTLERMPVAKRKAGRPKSPNPRGEGRPVRLDPDLYAKADVITRRRGVKLGPWISELLEPVINREYAIVLRELSELEKGRNTP
jgi:hypothetical protein